MFLKSIRDSFWNYPYILFIGKRSVFGSIIDFYKSTRPISHIFSTLIISLLISALILTQVQSVLGFNKDTFIEGVITGLDASGNLRGPSTLNPIQVSHPQLDEDIMELVYDSMIKIDQNNPDKPKKILVEEFTFNQEEQSYRFKLREDVYWHDSDESNIKKLTTKDIEATFNLIKELVTTGVPDVQIGEGAKNIELEVLDDYIGVFKIKDATLPNFYELMTFKILPSHKIEQYRDAVLRGIYTGDEKLEAIGTGPYKLIEVKSDEVILKANENYYLSKTKIENFKFRLLQDKDAAIKAINAGQIHAITNIDKELTEHISQTPNIEIKNSDVIYTQYWGLYFNLSDNGPKIFKNKTLRQAFSMAINRQLALKNVYEKAIPAYSPIPSNSEYHVKKYRQAQYDPQKAIEKLKKAGFVYRVNKVDDKKFELMHKDNKPLVFTLSFVNNQDRLELVRSIAADLLKVGILLKLDPLEPQLLSRLRDSQDFELLITGVSTFVDPDRYQFFHSSQIPSETGNGLNFGGYKSDQTYSVIDEDEKKVVRIPLVDKLLDEGRKTTEKKERQEKYSEFQKIIADEVPVVFLYHPIIRYALNKRVKNVSLDNIKRLSDRFENVHLWEIRYE